MHRFFVDPGQINGLIVRFDDDQAHQIRRVLRLRPGARVLALDGLGLQYEVLLEEVSGTRVSGLAASRVAAAGEPGARLTLFQSLLRREKFEWVLQKGTEVGVGLFSPVITRRSLVRDAEDVTPEKLERWRRIIREAAEQAGRGLLPDLRSPMPFAAAAPEVMANDVGLIAWERESRMTIRDALRARENVSEVAFYIGPEGGFEADEIDEAVEYGCIPVSLGPRILRTETAAIVGAALVLHELGELG